MVGTVTYIEVNNKHKKYSLLLTPSYDVYLLLVSFFHLKRKGKRKIKAYFFLLLILIPIQIVIKTKGGSYGGVRISPHSFLFE